MNFVKDMPSSLQESP